ncbi:FG-GAP repeat protein [Nitrosomonas sp. Nm84]|uniref:integrin alpha n=1 Tax=Nitrosomonas sp. Nm84 TaxID=200124 RepID=UPI000D8FEAC7|nr:integrin alpha [Nitrosomonas sp. Nm84]PXW88259.1 FG-GAP repeat protein [Nitrosomonas sp. Nm84]
MALTDQQQISILQLTQAMFNITPGAIYLQALGDQMIAGKSLSELAQPFIGNIFIEKPYHDSFFASAFVNDLVGDLVSTDDKSWATGYINNRMAAGATQAELIAELPQALSAIPASDPNWGVAALHYNTSLATKVVDNLAGDPVTVADKAFAVNEMLTQMAAGQTFGSVIEWAITALNNVDHADPTWGNAAALFDNRIAVSKYYSVDKVGSATHLLALRQSLVGVTADAASVVTAKAAIDDLLKSTIPFLSLNGSNGFRLDGIAKYDSSGESVSSAGDVNGDGFDDVIIGARYADSTNGYDAGSSYVIFGKGSGFDATLALSSLNGLNGFRLDGVATADYSGVSVSSAGDINGDGFDDVIVGALETSTSNSSYVVFGKAAGFSPILVLSNLNGSDGFRLNNGSSVSSAGDVNGDGFDDVIIGALSADPSGDNSGSSYVVFGKASAFSATLDSFSLNGDNGFRLDRVAESDGSGSSVSSAGDVNGDGFDDVIVGAPYADPNGDNSGSSYVIFGKASGFTATLNLSSLDGNNGFRLNGAAQFDESGYAVSSAGDVNGDGFDDVIVGARYADPNGENSGSSYVIFGKASGFSATLDLSSLNGRNGFRLDGVAKRDFLGATISGAGDFNGDGFDDLMVTTEISSPNTSYGGTFIVFGKASGFDAAVTLSDLDSSDFLTLNGLASRGLIDAVSGAGDINGDGFDDVIVGLPAANSNEYDSGSSYVIFGGNFTAAVIHPGTPSNDNLRGTSAAERFATGNGNDTMTGGGFYGGVDDDIIQVSDLDFQLVDGGTGNDILSLASSLLNLSLANVRGRISDIETIDLTGTGNNTLALTPLDVVNLSDSSNTLKVDGNAGDHVVGLSNGWADGGIQGDFHIYTDDAAVLLVGINVTTDFV